jgi:hypothetical protein
LIELSYFNKSGAFETSFYPPRWTKGDEKMPSDCKDIKTATHHSHLYAIHHPGTVYTTTTLFYNKLNKKHTTMNQSLDYESCCSIGIKCKPFYLK